MFCHIVLCKWRVPCITCVLKWGCMCLVVNIQETSSSFLTMVHPWVQAQPAEFVSTLQNKIIGESAEERCWETVKPFNDSLFELMPKMLTFLHVTWLQPSVFWIGTLHSNGTQGNSPTIYQLVPYLHIGHGLVCPRIHFSLWNTLMSTALSTNTQIWVAINNSNSVLCWHRPIPTSILLITSFHLSHRSQSQGSWASCRHVLRERKWAVLCMCHISHPLLKYYLLEKPLAQCEISPISSLGGIKIPCSSCFVSNRCTLSSDQCIISHDDKKTCPFPSYRLCNCAIKWWLITCFATLVIRGTRSFIYVMWTFKISLTSVSHTLCLLPLNIAMTCTHCIIIFHALLLGWCLWDKLFYTNG